jgi:hypothetical protein
MAGFSIYKINFEKQEQTILYEHINTIEEADLLAQLAMKNKKDINDLIFISPGWNRGIKVNSEVLELTEKYKVD